MIDYKLLNDSILYYENKGFSRIETPWLVTAAVDNITKPIDAVPFIVEAKKKNLIASGEQGFLYLYLKGYLPKGKLQTVTPCFRNDVFDFTHTKYFMKNELIQTDDTSYHRLDKIVEDALDFFQPMFKTKLDVITTSQGYDIMCKDHEIGSYGVRECDFLKWIYGTACAEPRTSSLIELDNR